MTHFSTVVFGTLLGAMNAFDCWYSFDDYGHSHFWSVAYQAEIFTESVYEKAFAEVGKPALRNESYLFALFIFNTIYCEFYDGVSVLDQQLPVLSSYHTERNL